ncbi:MAG: hypothetical protein HY554_19465 [Elusimicrobia bacterium]|nr:hypothetical protein [Elusimicrobiota bacterium]
MKWAILLLSVAPAWGQMEVGTGIGPEAVLYAERGARQLPPAIPLALATSLAFDTTTWAGLHVSSVPAHDLTRLIRRGYGKLELLEAVLIAAKAGVALTEVTEPHDKGKSLREVAKDRGLDFDPLYEEALRVDQRLVDELLPSVMTVSVRSPKESGAAPGAPAAREPAPRPSSEKPARRRRKP